MVSGEWEFGSGKWEVGSGKWEVRRAGLQQGELAEVQFLGLEIVFFLVPALEAVAGAEVVDSTGQRGAVSLRRMIAARIMEAVARDQFGELLGQVGKEGISCGGAQTQRGAGNERGV